MGNGNLLLFYPAILEIDTLEMLELGHLSSVPKHSMSRWLVEMISNVESVEQSWLTGKLSSVHQQIRASAKCLKLWEKSILSNETAARAATRHPFVPTQQESFFTSLHMTNRESCLTFNILGIDAKSQ